MVKELPELVLDKEGKRFIAKSSGRETIYDKTKIEDILSHLESRNLKTTSPYILFKGLLEKLYAI